MKLAIHHVALSVADLEQSINWYREKLDFREVARFELTAYDIVAALLEREGVRIELFQAAHGIPAQDAGATPAESLKYQGMRHVAFEVPDVDLLAKELEANGVEIARQLKDFEPLRIRNFWIRDNSGILLEFVSKL